MSLLLSPWPAFAATVVLDHDVPVYTHPEFSMDPMTYLRKGQTVQSSEGSKNGFRKIRMPGFDGKFGWVDEEDFILRTKSAKVLGTSTIMGIGGDFGSVSQGKKQFATQDQTQYSTSGYSGSISEVRFFLNYPLDDRYTLSMSLGYQQISFNGNAIETQLPVAPKKVKLDETLAAVAAEMRCLLFSRFWLGGELEYARAISQNLTLDGLKVPTFSEDAPNLVKVSLTAGADWNAFSRVVIIPELKFGVVPMAKPILTSYAGSVAVGWLF